MYILMHLRRLYLYILLILSITIFFTGNITISIVKQSNLAYFVPDLQEVVSDMGILLRSWGSNPSEYGCNILDDVYNEFEW